MTDEEKFHKELGEKAIEYAKSHSSDEEEQKSLALAFIAGANDYAWMALESRGIAKEDYKNIQSFLKFIEKGKKILFHTSFVL